MISVVTGFGARCVFVGAHREVALPASDRWEGVDVERIGPHFPLVNGRRPLTYARGVIGYWFSATRWLMSRRPSLIHASDFETGVPGVLIARLLGVPVVYNIHDNLSVRYSVPRWAAAVLNVLEGVLVCASSVTLVPEAFRRDLLPRWARAKVRVVRNAPEDPGYTAVSGGPTLPPRVLFAGWLDFDRGLRELVHLARTGAIRLIVAGEGDERVRSLITNAANVEYLGFCTHQRIMGLTADCDYVAAFYNPARTINRYAASNKIAEALAVGRPVLINAELMVAPRLAEAGAALVVPYNSLAELSTALDALQTDPAKYMAASAAARALYETDYHATQVRRTTVDALLAAGLDTWQ